MTTHAFPRNAEGVDIGDRSAVALMSRGVFPEWWTFVPVAGKATFVQEWTTKPLPREKLVEIYKAENRYRGLGVVTGEFSGGLIALDIDGLKADARWKDVVGDAYEAFGEESTMSWTSGKEGRRQILYRVPAYMLPELRHVKTLILSMDDGQWHLGQGDTNRGAGGAGAAGGEKYEEVVLRFNSCQSVVPGSPHPETSKLYRFLNYNHGQVAEAPQWVLEILLGVRRPQQFFSHEDELALDAELSPTILPQRQIRGWFFKEEVQRLLMPRLEELVFNHTVFDEYGWRTRDGSNPQRMSGCPWHGGSSGTAFQYAVETGCWDCKACAVGGDVLDFVHKIRTKDMYARRPQGADLESYVAEIATALGYDYPACANQVEVKTKETPLRPLTGIEFFRAAQNLMETFENAELLHYHLMVLVRDSGLSMCYRNGAQVEAAVERFIANSHGLEVAADWQARARGMRSYLIPDFISSPSSILLHARGGLGKTRLAVLIAKIVGQQLPMRVRGLQVKPTLPEGRNNVLFIGNDMSMADYAEYLDQQGIDSSTSDTWFHYKPQWQQSQYRQLVKWMEEIKPSLVVIDSLSSVSTMIAAKENEREYSNTLYRLARENGTAFPPTTFLWIHHDVKDGSTFRGTDTLRNAVHETWQLKELTDEERTEYGEGMVLIIDKSRGRRSGDRFLVTENLEEALSISDLTPTVQRSNRGLGDETPRTVVLGLLKEAEGPLSVKELRYQLNARLAGRAQQLVTHRTVQRWLQAWIAAGLVEEAELRQTGEKMGRPEKGYQVVASFNEAPDVQNPPPFFETSSAAVDPEDGLLDTPMSKSPVSKTPDHNNTVVSPENGETSSGAGLIPENLTETAGATETPSGGGVLDTDPDQNGMSKSPEDETLVGEGISEIGDGLLDSGSLVKETQHGSTSGAKLPSWLDEDADLLWFERAKPEGEEGQE